MTKLKVGNKAPDFFLPSSSASAVTLSQFIGKNVVLFFYPMDESLVCSKEAEAFRDKYEAFKELDAVVISISSQSVESHKAFANHHRLPFILLSDSKGAVRKLYGISATLGLVSGRVTFAIDREGIVRHIFSSQLQPVRHANEALLELRRISS